MTVNPLWDLVQQYMDTAKFNPKPADLARETGVSEQVLSKWKARPVFPRPKHLLAFAAGTNIPYEDLLLAVLQGMRYLPPGEGSAKVSVSRRWRSLNKLYGERFIEELKSASQNKPPIDLSDIFTSSEGSEPTVDRAAANKAAAALERDARERSAQEVEDGQPATAQDIHDAQ